MSRLGAGFDAALAQLREAAAVGPEARAEADAHHLWVGAVRMLAVQNAPALARLIKDLDRRTQEEEPIVVLVACAMISANMLRASAPLPAAGLTAAIAEYADAALDLIIALRAER
jgi:hypothetical protein